MLVEDPHGEACYLGWLQIREVGSACTAQDGSWGDDTFEWDEVEDEADNDPPPASMRKIDPAERWPDDPAHRVILDAIAGEQDEWGREELTAEPPPSSA